MRCEPRVRPEEQDSPVPFRWIDHTRELELELEASSERGVFEAALDAMRELLADNEAPERIQIPVELSGSDRALLIADWLGELAFLGETRGLVPDDLASFELGDEGLKATLVGSVGHPPHLVKGVAYHRLLFEPADGGWRARVVLDV
jgi:SHS2 domain-containing protein